MEDTFFLAECCESYILKKHSLVIASYPSLIIFGEIENGRKFRHLKYFKFQAFLAKNLLKVIEAIVTFFNDSSELTINNQFFSDISNNLIYYWKGFSAQNLKFIEFGIEINQSKTFKVSFDLEDINNFIYLIRRCLIASLCLKDLEEQFIEEILKLSIQQLISCKNNHLARTEIVNSFKQEIKLEHVLKNGTLSEILNYYNDIILVLKDLSDLHFCENEME
jgi:hypothetical protein